MEDAAPERRDKIQHWLGDGSGQAGDRSGRRANNSYRGRRRAPRQKINQLLSSNVNRVSVVVKTKVGTSFIAPGVERILRRKRERL